MNIQGRGPLRTPAYILLVPGNCIKLKARGNEVSAEPAMSRNRQPAPVVQALSRSLLLKLSPLPLQLASWPWIPRNTPCSIPQHPYLPFGTERNTKLPSRPSRTIYFALNRQHHSFWGLHALIVMPNNPMCLPSLSIIEKAAYPLEQVLRQPFFLPLPLSEQLDSFHALLSRSYSLR